ncbi:MAG: IS5 family transposase [Rhizobiales bacterium]|nr:IS5 family transposase [Hyphomicrobiales bacterium]
MMGIKRYGLSDRQWAKIAPLLPGKAGDPGRRGADNRLFVNGCLWVLRSGARWRDLPDDLPERYGRWKTVHRRFSRWCHGGVWDRVFAALTADRDNQYLMLDSTIVRAHQQAATGKGAQGSGAGAFPGWTDHQGPHARRCAGPTLAFHRDRRAGRRHHTSPRTAQGPGRGRRARRQGL